MPDNRFNCSGLGGGGRENVCIEANRVLDSCRDRDCFENVHIFLTNFGNEIIERTGNIRVKDSCITWSSITVDPIAFNKGFYSVNLRLYIKITFEACLSPGRVQEFDGVGVIDKNVVLFGGECNLNVFKSNGTTGFCDTLDEVCCAEGNVPTAIVEVVDPIILNAKIIEKKHDHHHFCCCSCCDIPDRVTHNINGTLCDEGERFLVVSIGLFSVVRIVRPAQFLIQATEYSVPDKECLTHSEENPCDIFRSMEFPTHEFTSCTTPLAHSIKREDKGCGCK